MHIAAIGRMLGVLLMLFSGSMLPPLGVYWWYHDGAAAVFLSCFLVVLLSGLSLWWCCRTTQYELTAHDGFLVVVVLWVVLCGFGALPFYVYFYPHLSITDAVFETVSGLTTTGVTVFTQLDVMPHAILYYRQQLTLLGGVSVVVLALAVLPVLGIGGMQLYQAELGGVEKTTKLRPRLAQTAKALWSVYLLLVVTCGLAYWLAGMPLFDAVCTSFSTIATAGFAVHDQSLAFYHSQLITAVSIVFMLLGSINFALHYRFIQHKRLSVYTRDPELRAYLILLLVVTLSCVIILLCHPTFRRDIFGTALDGLFTVINESSTGGFSLTNFDQWPGLLPFLLILMALIGGCCGSTSGGLKILRLLLVKKQAGRELTRLLHPSGVFSLYLGDTPVAESAVQAVSGFFVIYMASLFLVILALRATGLDLRSAFGSAVAALSNSGIGLGRTALTFHDISDASKWILTCTMLAGRLEILSLLVLCRPSYWRG